MNISVPFEKEIKFYFKLHILVECWNRYLFRVQGLYGASLHPCIYLKLSVFAKTILIIPFND